MFGSVSTGLYVRFVLLIVLVYNYKIYVHFVIG